MKILLTIAGLVLALSWAQPARSEVDVQTPWANVYVGPDGVYVNGPWGRVEVPSEDRKRVCQKWREEVLTYYEKDNCSVTFDAAGCTIETVDCPKG